MPIIDRAPPQKKTAMVKAWVPALAVRVCHQIHAHLIIAARQMTGVGSF
jgi:hypothetical protein